LLAFQQRFAATLPGVVIDGRDIGTVVCPDARVKLFVTASPAERARRRQQELLGRGESADYAAILADLEERDLRDTTRPVAPLRPAEDAVTLDTTALDADGALQTALQIVESRLKAVPDTAI
ncbi:MAG: (d)CMP kinase, partial [Proteobacteria bacterium]|nr:(d)CMP kinase [Pseudomonadota bacterium]